MKQIVEAYRKVGDPDDRFDIDFWQRQGPAAIFDAANELVRQAQLMKNGDAYEPRLQRTVERFSRV